MASLQDLTIPQLLEEEEKATRKRNECPTNSNSWRQWDAKIEKVLAELKRRADEMEKLH